MLDSGNGDRYDWIALPWNAQNHGKWVVGKKTYLGGCFSAQEDSSKFIVL